MKRPGALELLLSLLAAVTLTLVHTITHWKIVGEYVTYYGSRAVLGGAALMVVAVALQGLGRRRR